MKKSELTVGMQCMITDKKSSLFGALVKITNLKSTIESSSVMIEFVKNFTHRNGGYSKGDTISFPYRTLIERDPLFYGLNQRLYEALLLLLHANKGDAGGSIDYSSKDYSYINDELDHLAVKYFCEQPDGDEQERNFKSSEVFLTDKEAYIEMITRFENTIIH